MLLMLASDDKNHRMMMMYASGDKNHGLIETKGYGFLINCFNKWTQKSLTYFLKMSPNLQLDID